MESIIETNGIMEKTRELCQAILEGPEFQDIRERVDRFMADEAVKLQYQLVSEKGEHLQHKQQQGVELTPAEVADFEAHRDVFLSNPVARGFLDAQQEMHKVQESVGQYVSKTFELGRIPTEQDFSGCGSGCGCH